jgi:hypothetical protein
VSDERRKPSPDDLKDAVERTFAATAGSASEGRDRVRDLLDEVTRRGRDAGQDLARRGEEAGGGLARRAAETSSQLTRRVRAAIQELLDRPKP